MSKTSLQLPLWTLILVALTWVGALASQSLVDLVDTLVIVTAFTHAFQTDQFKVLFTGFRPSWFWPVWIGVVALGLYLNVGHENTKAWIEFLEWRWVITFLSFIYLLRHVPNLENELPKISWVLLALNIFAIYIYLQNPDLRAGGVGNAIMAFSHSMGVMFCLWFYLSLNLIEKRVFHKIKLTNFEWVQVFVMVTAGFLILQTMTRGVWIGVGVGILVTAYIKSKKFFGILIVTGLVAVSLLFLAQPKYFDRLFSRGDGEKQSNSERIALWKGNLRIIQDNPVWGVGFQQNKFHLRKYYDEMGLPADQRISHAHNQYLQIWAGTGAFGILLFLYFWGVMLHSGYRATKDQKETEIQGPRALPLGAMAALICFMVGALTEANFNIAKNRILFLLVAALVVVISRQYDEPKRVK